jgi:TonB family protein
MMCFLKRILPFALTLTLGLVLGNLFGKAPRPASYAILKYENIGTGSGSRWSRVDEEFAYDRVFSPRDVDRKARVLSRPEPRYTDEARENLVQGTVVLRAVFSGDGSVRNIRAVSELPNGLTERAIEAAREIKFSPALKDGRAVSQCIQIEYNFNLY